MVYLFMGFKKRICYLVGCFELNKESRGVNQTEIRNFKNILSQFFYYKYKK